MTVLEKFVPALKFLGPHLLAMIKDAVSKWNHKVPDDRVQDFENDRQLIWDKLSSLTGFEEHMSLPAYAELANSEPSANHFVKLGKAAKSYSEMVFMRSCEAIVSALISRNRSELAEINHSAVNLIQNFTDSFEASAFTFSPSSDKQSVRLIDDALLALSRMSPGRLIAPSGTLILRDLQPVTRVGWSKEMIEDVKIKTSQIYDIEVFSSYMCPTIVVMTPISPYLDSRALEVAYGQDITLLEFSTLMSLEPESVGGWLSSDPNISPEAILNKVLGSSVTSLSTVISDLQVFLALVYTRSGGSGKSIEEIEHDVRCGPYYAISDGMLFMSPATLFSDSIKGPKGSSLLKDDFETVTILLELHKICLKDHDMSVFLRGGAPSRVLSSKLPEKLYPSTSRRGVISDNGPTNRDSILHILESMEAGIRNVEQDLLDGKYDSGWVGRELENINRVRRHLGK